MNVFFTDRNLGKAFPAMLREAAIQVEESDAHFAPDTSDEEWLREVGSRDWIVLTHDKRIRYKPNELAAVMSAGIGMFVLVGKMSTRQLAVNFIRTLAVVEAHIERTARPFIARIYRPVPSELARNPGASGRVEAWLSLQDYQRKERRHRG